METLKENAAWIRTKIKRCYHADKFIEAEKYEYELSTIEEQMKQNLIEQYEKTMHTLTPLIIADKLKQIKAEFNNIKN